MLNASAEGVTSTDIHYCILTNGQQGCPDNEVESALREVLKRLATPSDLIRFIHGSSVSEAKSTEILRVLNKKISEVLIRSKGEEFSGQGNALSNRSTKTRSDDDITPSH